MCYIKKQNQTTHIYTHKQTQTSDGSNAVQKLQDKDIKIKEVSNVFVVYIVFVVPNFVDVFDVSVLDV